MDKLNIDDCFISPLKTIPKQGGYIKHGIKSSDFGYSGFGELYFSSIACGVVSDWKRHNRMTMNLLVPIGEIKFCLHDQRLESKTYGNHCCIKLGLNNYFRLTVPPKIWVAFEGIGSYDNVLANVASLEHDINEVDREPIEKFYFHKEVV